MSPGVSPVRRCSRTACTAPAAATLTYVYADRAAVVGPLATYAEPHCYDLCDSHSVRLTAPLGWEVVRHRLDPAEAVQRSNEDLEALAEAVREAGRPARPARSAATAPAGPAESAPTGTAPVETARRGHLRALPTPL